MYNLKSTHTCTPSTHRFLSFIQCMPYSLPVRLLAFRAAVACKFIRALKRKKNMKNFALFNFLFCFKQKLRRMKSRFKSSIKKNKPKSFSCAAQRTKMKWKFIHFYQKNKKHIKTILLENSECISPNIPLRILLYGILFKHKNPTTGRGSCF